MVKKNFPAEKWPSMRACHCAVSLCEISDKAEESPSNPRLMILFGKDSQGMSLKDVWMFTVNSKSWNKVSIILYFTLLEISGWYIILHSVVWTNHKFPSTRPG